MPPVEMFKSYVIPVRELTLSEKTSTRSLAIAAGVQRALAKAIVGDPSELVIRNFENILDAGTALEQWNTAALTVVGTAYTCFQAVAAPILAVNKLAVFYKVGVETIPCPVSLLTFRTGGAAGNIIAEFDLEQLVNGDEIEGYFSAPVIIDPNTVFAIQATARIATGALARVTLGALIFEPKGQRISVS